MGVVQVKRRWGEPKVKYLFSSKIKPLLVKRNVHCSKKHKLKYDFSTFHEGGWEFLSFDVTAAVQQRENSTPTPSSLPSPTGHFCTWVHPLGTFVT